MKRFLPLLFVLLFIPFVAAQATPDLKSLESVFRTVDTVFIILILAYIAISIYKIVRLYRKEGVVFLKFFSKAKAMLAIALSLIGVIIFVIGIFQPWYKISADVNAGQINKKGFKKGIFVVWGKAGEIKKKQF